MKHYLRWGDPSKRVSKKKREKKEEIGWACKLQNPTLKNKQTQQHPPPKKKKEEKKRKTHLSCMCNKSFLFHGTGRVICVVPVGPLKLIYVVKSDSSD